MKRRFSIGCYESATGKITDGTGDLACRLPAVESPASAVALVRHDARMAARAGARAAQSASISFSFGVEGKAGSDDKKTVCASEPANIPGNDE